MVDETSHISHFGCINVNSQACSPRRKMLSYDKKCRRELTDRGKLIVQPLPSLCFFCCQELTGILADELPPVKGLGGVQPPPFLQLTHDAQPHCDAALRSPVPAQGPARAPVAALPEAPHPRPQGIRHLGLHISARAPRAAALLRGAPASSRGEA